MASPAGLLHVADRKLYELTPAYFNQTAAPFDYDPAAGAPLWLKFLGELWPTTPSRSPHCRSGLVTSCPGVPTSRRSR